MHGDRFANAHFEALVVAGESLVCRLSVVCFGDGKPRVFRLNSNTMAHVPISQRHLSSPTPVVEAPKHLELGHASFRRRDGA